MIDKLICNYLETMTKAGYKSETIRLCKYPLIHFSLWLKDEGIFNLNDVNPFTIEKYHNKLKESKNTKKYINEALRIIKVFFKYHTEKGIVKTNPFQEKEVKTYPAEFAYWKDYYLKIKTMENTCYNTFCKIRLSIILFYDFILEKEVKQFREIKKEDLKDFIKFLIDKTDQKGNPLYKAVSVNKIIACLKKYIIFLSKKGFFSPGFSGNLTNLRTSFQITRNILTRKELTALFNLKTESLYEFMLKTICIVQYAGGVRIGELLSIEIKDIDFENKCLNIFESKTLKERAVIIGDVASKYLKIFVDYVRPKVCFDTETSEKIFLSRNEGAVLHNKTINKNLKRLCKKAGITKTISTHCFRHSYATHLLENGLGIKEVADLLGHKSLKSAEYYTRLNPERLRTTIIKYHPMERTCSEH